MELRCNLNSIQSLTLVELQDDHPGGLIQAISTLPNLNSEGSLDPTWLEKTVETLIKNKLIPVLIKPVLNLPKTPSYPIPPSGLNLACGSYGRPSQPPPPPPPLNSPSVNGCENERVNINCQAGTITGLNVKYGRWDTTTCPTESSVFGSKSYTINPQACIGNTSCGVNVNNDLVKDDPLPGTRKQFTISPLCSENVKTYSAPHTSLRLYTREECDLLDGNFSSNGECTKKTGGSWSWDCRNLNDGDAVDTEQAYKNKMNTYRNSLENIKTVKQRYNNAVTIYNEKNSVYMRALRLERCFYNIRLNYAEKTFFSSAVIDDVLPNNKMVNYKNEIINKLKLKKLILDNLARLTFKNNLPLIEGFQGGMGASSNDINNEHTILTNELTASKLNKRRVDYTLEKNKANQNLLTLFGILNIVALGIIYGISSN
jgi:hypothetical protein